MPMRRELERLSAALSQWNWFVECQPSATDAPPKLFEVIDFRLGGESETDRTRLLLNLKQGVGVETTLATEIGHVFLEGQFGSMYAESRRFTVSCLGLPEAKCRKIREGVMDWHWRAISMDDVGLVFVRDKNAAPGWPIPESFTQTYGFEEHVLRYGSGDNLLRTSRVAQPQALQVGDILATGDRVLSPPRWGRNSSVLVHLTGGHTGHWIKMVPRLPIALLTKEDDAPPELWDLK